MMVNHMGSEELPITWWEYVIAGAVGVIMWVALAILFAVVCYALDRF